MGTLIYWTYGATFSACCSLPLGLSGRKGFAESGIISVRVQKSCAPHCLTLHLHKHPQDKASCGKQRSLSVLLNSAATKQFVSRGGRSMSQGLWDSLENVGCWSPWCLLGLHQKSFFSLLWLCFQTADPIFVSCWLHRRFKDYFWKLLSVFWHVSHQYVQKRSCAFQDLGPSKWAPVARASRGHFDTDSALLEACEMIIKGEWNWFWIFHYKEKAY